MWRANLSLLVLLRPYMFFGNIYFGVWFHHIGSSDFIEEMSLCQVNMVQRKILNFAAFILQIEHPPHNNAYLPMSSQLKLCSLSDRFNAPKHYHGSIDCPALLVLLHFKVPSRTMRTYICSLFVLPLHSNSYGFNNPIHRILRNSNIDPISLCQNLVYNYSLLVFIICIH